MSFQIGDVVCVKTTGERVCVLSESEEADVFEVRRAIASEGGTITHSKEEFNSFELEAVADHAERQVGEMILKSKAQVKLMKVESKLQKELEQDEIVEAAQPALAIVPKPVLN